MWSTLLLVILCAKSVSVAYGSFGVSLSKLLDINGWNALVTTTPVITSASIHILFYNGSINPNAASTIKSAWNANIRDLSVYMHPCLNTSVYSVQYEVECGTAQDQFQSVLDTLSANNIHFSHHLSSVASNTPSVQPSAWPIPSPTSTSTVAPTVPPTSLTSTTSPATATPSISPTQATAAPTATTVALKRLFVCVEDEVPNRYMSNNHGENVKFMLELQHEAVRHGVQLGIYTSKNEWLNIMTAPVDGQIRYPVDAAALNHTATNPFNDLPLWTPRFDSVNSMDFYAPFGDWARVFMKEVSGSTTALHRIGSDRVGMTFVSDAVGTQFYANQILEYIVT